MTLPSITNLKFLHTANGTINSDYPVLTPSTIGGGTAPSYNAGGWIDCTAANATLLCFDDTSALLPMGNADYSIVMCARINAGAASDNVLLHAHTGADATHGLAVAIKGSASKTLTFAAGYPSPNSGYESYNSGGGDYADDTDFAACFIRQTTGCSSYRDASVTSAAPDTFASSTLTTDYMDSYTGGDGDKIYFGGRCKNNATTAAYCFTGRIYWVAVFDTAISAPTASDWTVANLRSTYLASTSIAPLAGPFGRFFSGKFW